MTGLLLIALVVVVILGGLGVFVATTYLVGLVAVLLVTALGGRAALGGRSVGQAETIASRSTRPTEFGDRG